MTSVFMAQTGFYNQSAEDTKRIDIFFGVSVEKFFTIEVPADNSYGFHNDQIGQAAASACDFLIAVCMIYYVSDLIHGKNIST